MAVPAPTPVTTPVEKVMDATAGAAQLHTPPGVGSLTAVENPTHVDSAPSTTIGSGLTVNVAVTIQPVAGVVYVTIVVPATTPVAIPVDEPITTFALLAAQVPPPVMSVNDVVNPLQTENVPSTGPGSG